MTRRPSRVATASRRRKAGRAASRRTRRTRSSQAPAGVPTTPKQADPAPGEKKIDGKAPGDPSAPKPKPLQGDPKFAVITTADGKTHLQITIDHASTWVDMLADEKDASLDARIDKAVEKLQDSRDPEKHGMVVNPVKESGFQPEKGATGKAGTGEDAKKQGGGHVRQRDAGRAYPGRQARRECRPTRRESRWAATPRPRPPP